MNDRFILIMLRRIVTLCLGFVRLLCGMSVILLFGLASGRGLALEGSISAVFTVDRLQVSTQAATDIAARSQALLSVKRTAFEKLVARLTQQRPSDVRVSDRDLDRLVRDVSFFSERAGGGTYSAEVSVTFWPELIRDFLTGNAIPFTEIQPRIALIIPILCRIGHCLLWERNNIWYDEWAKESDRLSGLLTIAVPQGLAEDAVLVSAFSAQDLRADGLDKIRERYEADLTLVSIVTETMGDVEVVSRLHSPGRAVLDDQRQWERAGTLSREDWKTVITEVYSWAEEELRSQDRDDADGDLALHTAWLTLNTTDIEEFLRVRRVLSTLSGLDGLAVVEQTANQTLFRASMTSTVDDLRSQMRLNGLDAIPLSDRRAMEPVRRSGSLLWVDDETSFGQKELKRPRSASSAMRYELIINPAVLPPNTPQQ